jgi:hypothetical protein
MDLVACIVPTLNRPETHESLYATFCAQDYPHKLLIVLDESAQPSPFFSQCADPRVWYVHAPSEKGEVTRIGSTRNRLCELAHKAGASIIAHLDDDDHYASGYLSRMLQKLGDKAIAKLAVFRLLVDGGEAAGTIWQWDVRSMGGQHYGLRGDAAPQGPVDMDEDEDPMYAEACRFGYGFSYVYRTSLWEKYRFPEEGTEDYPWVRQMRQDGVEVVEVGDFADGCLHVVHNGSSSMVWPQVYIGKKGLGSAPTTLRDFVRWRMLGALPSMYELPKGKDFFAEVGVTYNIVAKIGSNHTLKSITTRAESWGLTVTAARDNVSGSEFGVKDAPKGYRLVQIMGSTKKRIKIPWKGNKLVALFDKSCIERAWADQPIGSASPQINSQLTPAAAGMGRSGIFMTQPTCSLCRNYAWTAEMGPGIWDRYGNRHHPSCSCVDGLGASRAAMAKTTLGPRGRDELSA